MAPADRSFEIRVTDGDGVQGILDFHLGHLTPYLLERDRDFFAKLVEDDSFENLAEGEKLLEVRETTNGADLLVGMCYVTPGHETADPFEFGGLFVTDDCRGCGLASALGIVAIASQFVWDPPSSGLIAHVHELNNDPRRVLASLGFRQTDETMKLPNPPENMAKNADGEVIGHCFEFQPKYLEDFATWLERFRGITEGKTPARLSVRLKVLSNSGTRAQSIRELRELARELG